MEHIMEKLKDFLSSDGNDAFAVESEATKKAKQNEVKQNPKNIELAKLYEDAYEYEEELAAFEAELDIVAANSVGNLVTALTRDLPNDERDYAAELHTILVATWTHKVETQKSHPREQLELIKANTLDNVVTTLATSFPDYEGDFEKEVHAAFTDRLNTLIAIKKEHIDEEIAEIKIAGLKPSYVKRIYKQVHNL